MMKQILNNDAETDSHQHKPSIRYKRDYRNEATQFLENIINFRFINVFNQNSITRATVNSWNTLLS